MSESFWIADYCPDRSTDAGRTQPSSTAGRAARETVLYERRLLGSRRILNRDPAHSFKFGVRSSNSRGASQSAEFTTPTRRSFCILSRCRCHAEDGTHQNHKTERATSITHGFLRNPIDPIGCNRSIAPLLGRCSRHFPASSAHAKPTRLECFRCRALHSRRYP